MQSTSKLGKYRYANKHLTRNKVLQNMNLDGYLNVDISHKETGDSRMHMEEAMYYCRGANMSLDELAALLFPEHRYNYTQGLFGDYMVSDEDKRSIRELIGEEAMRSGIKDAGRDMEDMDDYPEKEDYTDQETEEMLSYYDRAYSKDSDDETADKIRDYNSGIIQDSFERKMKEHKIKAEKGSGASILGKGAALNICLTPLPYTQLKEDMAEALIRRNEGPVMLYTDRLYKTSEEAENIIAMAEDYGYKVVYMDDMGLKYGTRSRVYDAPELTEMEHNALVRQVMRSFSARGMSHKADDDKYIRPMADEILRALLNGTVKPELDKMTEYLKSAYGYRKFPDRYTNCNKSPFYTLANHVMLMLMDFRADGLMYDGYGDPVKAIKKEAYCIRQLMKEKHFIIIRDDNKMSWPARPGVLSALYMANIQDGSYRILSDMASSLNVPAEEIIHYAIKSGNDSAATMFISSPEVMKIEAQYFDMYTLDMITEDPRVAMMLFGGAVSNSSAAYLTEAFGTAQVHSVKRVKNRRITRILRSVLHDTVSEVPIISQAECYNLKQGICCILRSDYARPYIIDTNTA